MKPFKHQLLSLKHDASNKLVFDCSDPGTGKTCVRILAFAKRRAAGSGCALVLAPRSLLRNVWANDVRKFAPELTVSVADASNREKAFAAQADIYVTNVDAATWLAKQPKAFFARFSELIIDESDAFKHHTSQRSKAILKISKYFEHRKLLTGTPNTNSITDIWHQMMILDGGERLGNSFYRFRDTVCIPQQVGRAAYAIKWHDREGAHDAVFGQLADVVIRHRFEDCVDIPENHVYTVDYDLTDRQAKAYGTIEEDQLLFLSREKVVTAVHAAAVATKLLQVASGAVYTRGDEYSLIDTGRYELALDMIEKRKHSLCFFLWQHQRDLLVAEAKRRGVRYCVFDGASSDKEREDMVKSYQAGLYQVMFAHPASAGHGLTLTRGTLTLWVSPTYNLAHYTQGSKRIPRMGQTQKTETVTILAPGTIEERVYHEILMGKKARMGSLLDLFSTANKPAPTKKILESV